MPPRPLIHPADPSGTPPLYFAQATTTPAGIPTIHVTGQPGATASGHVPSDYESQIHLALLNVRRALAAAGAAAIPHCIAKLTLYIVDYDPQRRLHTRHLQRFLQGHRPAVTLVPVPRLADERWLFEVEAVACVDAAPAAPAISPALGAVEEAVDVVVVGAGLSGLVAARDAVKGGLRCVVLEARDRVGGKTWSKGMSDGKGVVDLGAAWINDTNQSRMIEMARRYGAELVEQNTTGNCAFQGFDGKCSAFAYGELPGFTPETQALVAHIRDTVQSDSLSTSIFDPHNPAHDGLTFDAYLRQLCLASPSAAGADQAAALATAAVWTRAMLGREPRDISALFFLNYCASGGGLLQMRSDRRGGGQHLRCRQGMQLFANELAARELPRGTVKLNTPVAAVRHLPGGGAVVETASGDGESAVKKLYRARKVVVSVPSPVLRDIVFDPPLPAKKTVLAGAAGYGYYTKVMLVFREPFWVEKGFCGLAQSFCGPASVVRDTSVPADGKWVLTCFLSGDFGAEWAKLGEGERTDALLKQVGELFGDGEAPRRLFCEAVGYEWVKEKWSGWGCPSVSLPPGALDAVGDTLREPVGDIHFVGTETAGEWKGYMEGAVRSGERGAAEVLSLLSKAGAKL